MAPLVPEVHPSAPMSMAVAVRRAVRMSSQAQLHSASRASQACCLQDPLSNVVKTKSKKRKPTGAAPVPGPQQQPMYSSERVLDLTAPGLWRYVMSAQTNHVPSPSVSFPCSITGASARKQQREGLFALYRVYAMLSSFLVCPILVGLLSTLIYARFTIHDTLTVTAAIMTFVCL